MDGEAQSPAKQAGEPRHEVYSEVFLQNQARQNKLTIGHNTLASR